MNRFLLLPIIASAVLVGCTNQPRTTSSTTEQVTSSIAATSGMTTSPAQTNAVTTSAAQTSAAPTASSFVAEVWADNWFSLTVNGVPVGEDSVPITTERSFNAETLTFTATYPLTITFVTKDYKATDSGLEYIGTDRQQMGDGGFIAQFTDQATGQVVAATGDAWRALAVQRAPLNLNCVSSADPNTDCQFEIVAEPVGWHDASFDDTDWSAATVYSAADVGTKDGYETIDWVASAQLIWTSDLQVDNTILWRFTAEQIS